HRACAGQNPAGGGEGADEGAAPALPPPCAPLAHSARALYLQGARADVRSLPDFRPVRMAGKAGIRWPGPARAAEEARPREGDGWLSLFMEGSAFSRRSVAQA